jgi:hypothetical protein
MSPAKKSSGATEPPPLAAGRSMSDQVKEREPQAPGPCPADGGANLRRCVPRRIRHNLFWLADLPRLRRLSVIPELGSRYRRAYGICGARGAITRSGGQGSLPPQSTRWEFLTRWRLSGTQIVKQPFTNCLGRR